MYPRKFFKLLYHLKSIFIGCAWNFNQGKFYILRLSLKLCAILKSVYRVVVTIFKGGV